ncbi:C40 family peptidase [Peribacillus acanthi]|uniref:C40 family peptidase n=1 Tax=Peribacillus acanthi TaxID=2171554 RepID=UPI000D3E3566|nr:C40 family peptidase [Peribacillus acanthi]
MEKRKVVNVAVATVWTSYESSRKFDAKAISNPVDLEGWLQGLEYETLLELCNSNLVQTQILFGEEVLVVEENDGWSSVICLEQPNSKDERGYPGWVPTIQLVDKVDLEIPSKVASVSSKKTTLLDSEQSPIMELSYATRLPVVSVASDKVEVLTPTGIGFLSTKDVEVFESLDSFEKRDGASIVKSGEQFLGLPYLWGGMSSFGYDCSGFSYNMCKVNGYIIPRDAHDQAAAGDEVPLDELQQGDLLFFAYEEGKGRIHHVGIYYGEGKLLHSPNTGKTIEIIDLAGTIYEKELCAARRYWQATEG